MAFWDKITSRGNVEDRRGIGPVSAGGLGIGGLALVLAFTYFTGGDLGDVISQIDPNMIVQEQQAPGDTSQFEGQDAYEVFAGSVLGSANDAWSSRFSEMGEEYVGPKLVLFRGLTESACGNASAQVGPHYCMLDKTIYLDETFFEELTNRLGARGGDVAEAYVIAHEVGHHVQNELGLMEGRDSQEDSIALELQADCFAGIWAYTLRDQNIFEEGEISEAMDAAAAVGDDRIQEKVSGRVNPETWTHGSSEARMAAFNKGYETGSFDQCTALDP